MLNSFILKNVSKWVKIALQNSCKNSISLSFFMQKSLGERKSEKGEGEREQLETQCRYYRKLAYALSFWKFEKA